VSKRIGRLLEWRDRQDPVDAVAAQALDRVRDRLAIQRLQAGDDDEVVLLVCGALDPQ